MARKYELRQRAERQRETRRRITKAAVELHSTAGPSRTSISAIAERAGVQRHTVYAHFPDERSLYEACSAHVREREPPPDVAAWKRIPQPQRLDVALCELYAYYARNELLLANLRRDAELLPVLREIGAPRARHLQLTTATLAAGFRLRGRRQRRLLAAIALAVDFATWQVLSRNGLGDNQAAALAAQLVRCSAAES